MDKNQLEYWGKEIESSVIGNYQRMGDDDTEDQKEEIGALNLIIAFALIGLSVSENAPLKKADKGVALTGTQIEALQQGDNKAISAHLEMQKALENIRKECIDPFVTVDDVQQSINKWSIPALKKSRSNYLT